MFSLFLLIVAAHAQTRLVLDPGNTISTLAGSGRDGHTIAGVASDVALGAPRGMAYDSLGNLYVADSRNHQIDRVTPAGALTVIAGTGAQGFAGDGGPAVAAELNTPTALALAPDGAIVFADTGNHRIRRISDGNITTIAGTGVPGFAGDGGPATAARLRAPSGLAFATDGTLYIADAGNHRIRKVTSDGSLTTVAGTGAEDDTGDGGSAIAAAFRAPAALQMLSDGRLLIADLDAHRIRALLPSGIVTAYTATATLRRPEGLTTDAAGNLVIADAAEQQVLLSGADTAGDLSSATLAGNGVQGTATRGIATASALDSPAATAMNANGDVAIADRRNHQVQRVALASLVFGDVPAGQVSLPQTLTITNGSHAALTVAAVQIPVGYATVASGSTCPKSPFTLQASASCGIEVVFSPAAQGQQTAFIRVQLAGAPSATVIVSGNGTGSGSLSPSVTTLTSNGSISYAGTPVRLTSAVSGMLGAAPGGNVTFFDGSVPLATVQLTGGSATLATAAMQAGQHTVHAAYSGDAAYAGSTSTNITQTVVAAPDFTISSSALSYSGKAGGGISIPMSVLPVNGTLNHTVQLSVSGLPAGATALFTPSIFTLGGDAANVSLAITMPATLARGGMSGVPFAFASVFAAALFPLSRQRSHTKAFRLVVLILGITAAMCVTGCSGGFRATTTGTSSGSTTKTFNYTAVVTASTTGVMGDALTHTATIGLVVTQ